jgi:hypothetical protein
MSERKVKIMKVGPDVAAKWLEKNTHNRDLRQSVVNAYASAMKRGEWRLTPEPIAFCRPYTNGEGKAQPETLIEGQHRLWAVVESGAEVEFTVWWGCEHDELTVIGQAVGRTQGDVLKLARSDIKHPTVVATIVTQLRSHLFSRTGKAMSWETDLLVNNFLSELNLVAEYKRNMTKRLKPNMVSAVFASFLIDKDKTIAALDRLNTAVGFTERDPMRALHLYISDQTDTKAPDHPSTQFGKALCAFLAELDGKAIKHLRYDTSYLGDARRRMRPRIDGVVKELHEGKVPQFFYDPKVYSA